jgi:hypothetical protein
MSGIKVHSSALQNPLIMKQGTLEFSLHGANVAIPARKAGF